MNLDTLVTSITNHMSARAITITIMVALGFYILWRIQRANDKYDLRYLIVDTETHQVSIYKLGNLLALIVSTWHFVFTTLNNSMTETLYMMYIGTWSGINVANNALQIQKRKDQSQAQDKDGAANG